MRTIDTARCLIYSAVFLVVPTFASRAEQTEYPESWKPMIDARAKEAKAPVDEVLASKEKIIAFCEASSEGELAVQALMKGDNTLAKRHGAKVDAALAKLGPAFALEGVVSKFMARIPRQPTTQGITQFYDAWDELNEKCPKGSR
jgi:hypothetical protein